MMSRSGRERTRTPHHQTLERTIAASVHAAVVLGCVLCGTPAFATGDPTEVTIDGVLHVQNGTEPLAGRETIAFDEAWRAGGAEDDAIFGMIGQVLADERGNVYLLDRQLSEVLVYSPTGEYLRTLSREGEGPGETRRPRDMVMLPEGDIGIVQMMPGKIVAVSRDGTPAGEIGSPGDGAGGGFAVFFNAWSRGGRLYVCGERMNPRPPGVMEVTRFLARIGEDGTEQHRYFERRTERDMARFVWDESEDYFVQHGGLALGRNGRLYAAPVRDRYEIHVYAPGGELERVIERQYTPRRRSAADQERVSDSMRMIINGREIPKKTADTDPCVDQLWVDADEQLWVLNGHGTREQPAGVFQTYDVFDASGRFTRQVALACPGDPLADGLFRLADGRVVVVRGLHASAVAMVGSVGTRSDADTGEAPVLEVICYRPRSS
jgi:hypothetical protein